MRRGWGRIGAKTKSETRTTFKVTTGQGLGHDTHSIRVLKDGRRDALRREIQESSEYAEQTN